MTKRTRRKIDAGQKARIALAALAASRLGLTMKCKATEIERRQLLRDVIGNVFIVAYREDVSSLVSSLTMEGFNVEILRRKYTEDELTYSSASKTFLSHHDAWQRSFDAPGYTLICEADFVPCRGFGDFEVFWPLENPYAWGYLYQGSPRLLALIGSRCFLRGHTAPLVCYVINKNVARTMLKFFEYERGKHDFRSYFTFDAHLQWYIMGLGAEAFIPLYHYGEHGGLPNPEHAKLGSLSNRGQHRADNLMSSLHFLPVYANGKYWRFVWVRLGAHLRGFARLVTGRWISKTNVYHLSLSDMLKMYLIGFWRLVSAPW